jgi:ribonuclease HII
VLVAGIDEAGRGCIIGPLVVAGVMVKEENLSLLQHLGVKDSKLLSPKKRQTLFNEILRLAEKSHVVKLLPTEIDRAVESKRKLHKLNRLEAQTMTHILNALKPDEAYVDAADVLEERFKQHIQEGLTVKTKITSRHKADKLYPVVSAASIIAKVERDKEVELLKEVYGDFGSGYLADKKTLLFLRQWIQAHSEYPSCVRQSWKTAKRIKNEKGTMQIKLA